VKLADGYGFYDPLSLHTPLGNSIPKFLIIFQALFHREKKHVTNVLRVVTNYKAIGWH